jgi:hypothetical protein
MILKTLIKRKQNLQNELYNLHLAKPNPSTYMQKRSEIEYDIACIEEAIELEKKMRPFKLVVIGFIVVACALLVWAYVVSK